MKQEHEAIRRMKSEYAGPYTAAGPYPDQFLASAERSSLPDASARSMFPSMSELTDAKIAASEARTDTKLARADARFDAVLSKLDTLSTDISGAREDNRRTRDTVRNTGIALFFGLGGLLVAIALGLPAIYSLGVSTRDLIRTEIQQVAPVQTEPTNPG